jgi:large subunit ribosomal protein L15
VADSTNTTAERPAGKLGLHNLNASPGSHRDRKRIGRGPGSGTGKTSGKGHKGSKARAGHHGPGGSKPGFEGGQMPMSRRMPKRGFNNTQFRVENQIVRLGDLEVLGLAEVTTEILVNARMAHATKGPIKLLSNGEVTKAITVRGLKVSAGAKAKIEAAGGRVED